MAPSEAPLLIRVGRSKTDPEQHGQLVGVAHGTHAETDPVTALDRWLNRRGTRPGPLFLGFHYDCIGTRAFTGSGPAKMLKERAAAAGLPSEQISGHLLRAGHATTAAMTGAGLDRIAAQTRHTRISTRRALRPPPRSHAGHLQPRPRTVKADMAIQSIPEVVDMSAEAFEPEPVPLIRDQAGRLMVAGTRISLDVLVAAFQRGRTPEAIHEAYETVPLADVYAVFTYYLRHKAEVEVYLAEQEREATQIQRGIETDYPSGGLRAKLLARLDT